MSKISKFMICFIAVIISICSFVVPTYCYDTNYSIELVDSFPSSPNFYNLSNISYVKYTNFSITREVGHTVFYTTSRDKFSQYPDGYRETIVDNYSYTMPNSDFVVDIKSTYTLGVDSSSVYIYLLNWSISSLEGYEYVLNSSDGAGITFHWIPNGILNTNYTYNGCNIFYGYRFSFDIEYNNQYFYNDTFCITSGINIHSGIGETHIFTQSNGYKEITLKDNFNNYYNKKFYWTENVDSFYNNTVKFTTNSIDDIYIDSVDLYYTSTNTYLGNVNFRGGRLYFELWLKYQTLDNESILPLYSANTLGQDSLSSPLIPIGSNNFYKTAEWWDIPSHLYNFFIYLIFDAPIISNFTQLVMVIINFVVEVFEFMVGLFTGINNIFFISIFVGVIVLIFLLKIIFKG